MEYKTEYLGGGVKIATGKEHTFGTDAFLLASFAAPKPNDKACDLGSGCGIIPLLWLRDGLKAACAVDIQPLAVEQMRLSAEMSGLGGRLEPILADMRNIKGVLPYGAFDLVACNPPYKAANTGVQSRSQSDKIARHETLCTLDDCCAAASRLLRFGGRFCLCQLTERLVDVFAAMRANKLEPKRMRFVQKDKDSAPWLVLVEGKRGAKPFLKTEPPLLLYENGADSPEIRKLYEGFADSSDEKIGNRK